MKIKTTILASALALGGALLQPQEAAARAGAPGSVVSLADFKSELTLLQADVSATVDSLNAVKESAKKEGDLSKAVEDLGTHFKTMEARVETLRTNATTAKARVKAHYDAWAKELTEMQNAKLREKAQDRLSRSQKEFDKIIAEAADTKEKVLPFVSEVKDIVIYLNADLSKDAVDSLSNNIWKIGNRSRSVIGSIGDLIKQIEDTIKSLPQK